MQHRNEGIIPGFFLIYTNLSFWKVTTLESVLISDSCTFQDIIIFHWHPTILPPWSHGWSHPKIWGSWLPNLPPGLTPRVNIICFNLACILYRACTKGHSSPQSLLFWCRRNIEISTRPTMKDTIIRAWYNKIIWYTDHGFLHCLGQKKGQKRSLVVHKCS